MKRETMKAYTRELIASASEAQKAVNIALHQDPTAVSLIADIRQTKRDIYYTRMDIAAVKRETATTIEDMIATAQMLHGLIEKVNQLNATLDDYRARLALHMHDLVIVAAMYTRAATLFADGATIEQIERSMLDYMLDLAHVTPLKALDVIHNHVARAGKAHFVETMDATREYFDREDEAETAIAAWRSIIDESGISRITDSVCDQSRGYIRGYVVLEHYVPREGDVKAHYEVIDHVKIPTARGRIILPKLTGDTVNSAPSLFVPYDYESRMDYDRDLKAGRVVRTPTGEYVKAKDGAAIPSRMSCKAFVEKLILPAARGMVFQTLDEDMNLTGMDLAKSLAHRAYRTRFVPSLKMS